MIRRLRLQLAAFAMAAWCLAMPEAMAAGKAFKLGYVVYVGFMPFSWMQ